VRTYTTRARLEVLDLRVMGSVRVLPKMGSNQ
jgi:hypothetical protein